MIEDTPTAGTQIHFLASLTVPLTVGINAQSAVLSRGHTLTITNRILDAGYNRHGSSWLDLLDDPAGQEARWGEVKFARGPFPSDEETWVAGGPDWELALDNARQVAWAIVDEQERAEALRAVRKRFGSRPTSRQLQQLDGGRS